MPNVKPIDAPTRGDERTPVSTASGGVDGTIFSWLAILAAFCASACLFLIELFAGKMLLPRFGGAPGTWVSCLAFFQVALVAAYFCSDRLIRMGRPRLQVGVVAVLFATAAVFTPLAAWSHVGRAADAVLPRPLAVIALLAISIGPSFFVIATLAPLFGHWRGLWNHPGEATPTAGRDALSLYAAGNAGSFAALIAYPLVVEPVAGLARQADLLGLLFFLVAALTLAMGLHSVSRSRAAVIRAPDDVDGVGWSVWLRWLVLAAIPASWLASVTTYATVEIAPIPLLWIIPLGIYLLSFVVVFSPFGRRLQRFEPRGLVAAVCLAAWLLACNVEEPKWPVLAAHAVIFFVVCVCLHGILVDERPSPEKLSSLYLAMAVGGACGGLFNAVVAPVIFNAHHEFPLAIAAAGGIMPAAFPSLSSRKQLIAAGLAAALVAAASGLVPGMPTSRGFWMAAVAAAVVATLTIRRGSLRAAALATALLGVFWIAEDGRHVVHRTRTFFGVLRVCEDTNGPSRTLVHGSISHGVQLVSADPERRSIPLSYYHHTGPLGSIFAALERRSGLGRVGVAGLGIGTIASYARDGQEFTFFEIDPEVVRIACNRDWFTFLSDCRGRTRIVIEDARVSLQREPDRSLDLLVIDAFTGDSVPTHLLTREALSLYGTKLMPDGVIAIHVSNKYLDFVPIVAALAEDGGWMALDGHDVDVPDGYARLGSHWMALSRSLEAIQAIYVAPTSDRWQWTPVTEKAMRSPWTDDSTRVIEALR